MQIELIRAEAFKLLNSLPPEKLNLAFNYLKLLLQFPAEQLDVASEHLESLGWTMLALEAAEDDWS